VTDTRVMLRPRDITRDYGIPERTVWDLIARRDVESAKVGKRRLVWRESLERYLQGVTE
jgi:hypothetical protein